MKKYDWILFDIDETLLRFNSFAALEKLFASLKAEFSQEQFHAYEAKNKSLWMDYQNGVITLRQLQHDRFLEISKQLNIPPLELDRIFLTAITDVTTPLDGAHDLLKKLSTTQNLGAITNGGAITQRNRMKNTGIHDHFEFILTSEEAGSPKPHPNIFNHAFSLMKHPLPSRVLIVGDSLEADILGGLNAGIDTCWINHHQTKAPEHIQPHYEITTLIELEKWLK